MTKADSDALDAIKSKINVYISYQTKKENTVSIHQLQHIKRGLNAIGTGYYDKLESIRSGRD